MELPSGTVTLLFSDVEGSTTLVRELGASWPSALEQQRELARAAWAIHDGHELGTEGDSFFVAFATAEQAVSAALVAQRSMASAVWPDGRPVRIRIGVHTGSPQRHGEGYVGLDVHRAARVAACAHGGQVVLSDATAALLAATPDPGRALLDLGRHRLKDIPGEMRLHQLLSPGLKREFPPLRTLGGVGSLPATLTPIIGRSGELEELTALIVEDGVRLVTLTGPGGTGKSRLAVALAEALGPGFDDGTFFIPLAAATFGREIWSGIAQVLDVSVDGQVPPGFFDHVGHRRALLVLDNLEQIPDAAEVVRRLLADAPHLTLLVTSRRPLHVDGEYEHAVPPLELVPATPGQEPGAVELFVHHAQRARRTFALTRDNATDIAALCAALDGLPLAIEIAAARTKLLSPKAILARIDSSLDLASPDRGRQPRQRTVRQAIAWSFDLLDGPQQTVLTWLGVFDGGANLDALGAVLPADRLDGRDVVDLLFELVDASLVVVTETGDGEPRFGLLETVRRFAVESLRDNDRYAAAATSHAQFFIKRMARVCGRGEATTAEVIWIEQEIENVRAVSRRRGEPGVVLLDGHDQVSVTWVTTLICRTMAKVDRWADAIYVGQETPGLVGGDPTEAAALHAAQAWIHHALDNAEESLSLCRSARLLAPMTSQTETRRREWVDLRWTHLRTWALELKTLAENGDLLGAHEAGRRATEIAAAIGPSAEGFVQHQMYLLAYDEGDYERATQHYGRVRGDVLPGVWESNMADLDLHQDRHNAAQRRLAAAVLSAADFGSARNIIIAAETFAAAVGAQYPILCARVYGAAGVARAVEGQPNTAYDAAEDERVLARVRPLVDQTDWDAAWQRGRGESISDLMQEMASLPVPDGDD